MGIRRKRSIRAVVLIGLLALGLSACGDDDDEAGQDTNTTQAEPTGPNVLTIKETDYAFTIEGTAREGWLTLDIENTGKEWHMVSFSKFKAGKTTADVIKAFQEQGGPGGGEGGTTTSAARATSTTSGTGTTAGEEEEDPFAEFFEEEEYGAPGGFQFPGSRIKVTSNKLDAGKYAVMCFIPTEGEGTPHVAKGMIASLDVRDVRTPAPEPTETAQAFTLAKGKAPTGPATLPAGDATFKVTGDAEHEFTVFQPKPGRTFKDADDYFTRVFGEEEDSPPPPKGVAAQAPFTFLTSVFDFDADDTLYVTVNLKPGTYQIGCTYAEGGEDDDDSNDVDHGLTEMLAVRVT
jgi:hypothetical protein